MSETLTAIYDGRRVGQMRYETDRITFRYDGVCASGLNDQAGTAGAH